MASGFDKEKTKKSISLVLEKLKTESDPRMLHEYQRLFKKETSLFNRSKAAAYLLMLYDQGKTLRPKEHKRPLPSRPGRKEDHSDTQRFPLADKESVRLFFSVGRNRRVFPREILGIINTKTAISKEDIGAIRILDNYSFVQVRDSAAEKIIEALNGMNFRGRPLTVNYAKLNKDEDILPDSEQNQYDPKKEDDI
jgi:DbpA RNA binding domain.